VGVNSVSPKTPNPLAESEGPLRGGKKRGKEARKGGKGRDVRKKIIKNNPK